MFCCALVPNALPMPELPMPPTPGVRIPGAVPNGEVCAPKGLWIAGVGGGVPKEEDGGGVLQNDDTGAAVGEGCKNENVDVGAGEGTTGRNGDCCVAGAGAGKKLGNVPEVDEEPKRLIWVGGFVAPHAVPIE